MLNKISIEGMCLRDQQGFYFGKWFTDTTVFICPFRVSGYKERYFIEVNIVFLNELAIKAYNDLKANNSYVIIGKLNKFFYIPNLFCKKEKEDKCIGDFFKAKDLVIVGYKIYKSKNKRKSCEKSVSQLFNEKITSFDSEADTVGLELFGESKPTNLDKFKKKETEKELKEKLKKQGILFFDDEGDN